MLGKRALALAVCMIFLSASGVAQQSDEVTAAQEPLGGTHELEIFQGTKISAEQGQEIDTILPGNWAIIRPMRGELQTIHAEISSQLFSNDTIDVAGLATLQKKAAQLEGSINAELLKTEIELRSILQPSQIAEMSQHHQELAAAKAEKQNVLDTLSPYGGAPVEQFDYAASIAPAAMAAGRELDILRGVTLSSGQAAQVGKLLLASSARLKPTRQQLSVVQAEISNCLFSTGMIEANRLLALQEQASELTEKIRIASLNNAIEFRRILTGTQIAQIAQNHQHLIEVEARERALSGSQ